MREPGRLLQIANISDTERGQLSDVLDNLSQSNAFRVMENLLKEDFLTFLDIFQEDRLKFPSALQVVTRLEYIRIYNDSKVLSLECLVRKYKRKPETLQRIISVVQKELQESDGDV